MKKLSEQEILEMDPHLIAAALFVLVHGPEVPGFVEPTNFNHVMALVRAIGRSFLFSKRQMFYKLLQSQLHKQNCMAAWPNIIGLWEAHHIFRAAVYALHEMGEVHDVGLVNARPLVQQPSDPDIYGPIARGAGPTPTRITETPAHPWSRHKKLPPPGQFAEDIQQEYARIFEYPSHVERNAPETGDNPPSL